MKRLAGKISQKKGLPPGTLVHVSDRRAGAFTVRRIEYSEKKYDIADVKKPGECAPVADPSAVLWIDVVGLHRVDFIEELGSIYGIHPLVLEDILHTSQRPKIDEWDDYTYIVVKMLHFNEETAEIVHEQISLILRGTTLISLQETEKDDFLPIMERILNESGRIRRMGADYLAYSIIDLIVDSYFGILEKIGERIDALEEELITDPHRDTIHTIHMLKREMIFLRKAVWPMRDVLSRLERGDSAQQREGTIVYFKDLYDHMSQVIDTIELFRDMLSGMVDVYLSSINNRMNEVMKFLTVITTVFIPLSFIAGIYGMNFKYMPELDKPWGYFTVVAIMILLGLAMVAFFKKKKWL